VEVACYALAPEDFGSKALAVVTSCPSSLAVAQPCIVAFMTTETMTAIRSALALLSPSELARVSDALVAARDNPAQAVIAFRNAARDTLPTNPEAAEKFTVCAEIMAKAIAARGSAG
jgi:hypothetical protein